MLSRIKNLPFFLIVVIPTCLSLIYFSIFASDIYTSESSFVVRSARSQASATGVGALLQNVGISPSQNDTYTVQEFIRSRSALDNLLETLPVRSYYEDKGDWFKRFNTIGWDGSKEAFYQYFRKFQTVSIDSVSGIATLQIRAFDAAEGQKINQELLQQSENLINRLNERARRDSIAAADQTAQEAEERVAQAAKALSEYRIANGIFDIPAQSEMQLNLVARLQAELISIQSQLHQLHAIAPENPQIAVLTARETALKQQIKNQSAAILGKGKSMATETEEYQKLSLNSVIAQQQFTAAVNALQMAREEANRQQLYLEVISSPSLPDSALEPYRLYNIIATFCISLMLYGIFRLLINSVREHKN